MRGTTSDGRSGRGAETYRPSDDELKRLDPKNPSILSYMIESDSSKKALEEMNI